MQIRRLWSLKNCLKKPGVNPSPGSPQIPGNVIRCGPLTLWLAMLSIQTYFSLLFTFLSA